MERIGEYTEKFWYKRDGQNRPMITVCDIYDQDGKLISYGMSICSPKDNPDKDFGKMIARRRAYHALLKTRKAKHIGDTPMDVDLAFELGKENRFYTFCNMS